MWRVVLRPALLFLLPFLFYATWLLLRRTAPWSRDNWDRGAVSVLTLLGLAVAIVGMLALGVLADRHLGTYVPAHIENGVVISGRMQ